MAKIWHDISGRRLASARALRGYKPIQVAELLGVNPKRYHNWEADVCKVEDIFLQQLSSLLHVSVDYLTSDSLYYADTLELMFHMDEASLEELYLCAKQILEEQGDDGS